MNIKPIIFGATGMVGQGVLRECLLAPDVERVLAIGRSGTGQQHEKLRELVHARWDQMVNSPLSGVPKLVISEAGQFPELVSFFYDEIIARSHALFARVLRDGIARGEFRDLDVEYVTRALMAPLLVAALWKHSIQLHVTQEMDPEKYFDTSLDLLLAGLAAPAAGGNSR